MVKTSDIDDICVFIIAVVIFFIIRVLLIFTSNASISVERSDVNKIQIYHGIPWQLVIVYIGLFIFSNPVKALPGNCMPLQSVVYL